MSIKDRIDGWLNAFTGLGSALRDKSMHTAFQAGTRLSDQTLESLYHGEDIASIICDALPSEALRKGFYLSSDSDDLDAVDALRRYEKRLRFGKALKGAAIWSRVFGGCVIYMGIDDGLAEDQPVNEEAIKSITFLTVIDKRYLYPHKRYNTLERYGEVELYQVNGQPLAGGEGASGKLVTGALIHESRVLRLDGTLTTLQRAEYNNGWSDSVLEKVHAVIRDFGSSWQAVGHLMQDASQGVFKIKDLVGMLSSTGGAAALNSRMELVDLSRSVARAIMVDADAEDFRREAYSFAGVPDVLKLFMVRVSAAARMPVQVLFGSRVLSTGGLEDGGSEDTRRWYDHVQAYQTDDLAPAIERFWALAMAAQDFESIAPENWEVRFGKLWQMTDSEQATLEKTVAEKDKIYIDSGVVMAEEVSLSRFGPRGFSMETQINLEAREEMAEAELELAKEKAGEDPIEAAQQMAQATGANENEPPPQANDE